MQKELFMIFFWSTEIVSHSTEWGKENIDENSEEIEKIAFLERRKGRLNGRSLWLGSGSESVKGS